eukprot:14952038-Alexandrium_andersonii.AAC.1
MLQGGSYQQKGKPALENEMRHPQARLLPEEASAGAATSRRSIRKRGYFSPAGPAHHECA